jgi:hypothetical protein
MAILFQVLSVNFIEFVHCDKFMKGFSKICSILEYIFGLILSVR